jgi:CBS domain-containing protein
MKEREFWREPTGGHVYAVELEDGLVTGGCGPLDTAEIDERFLASFDYSPDQAAWLEEHRAEFDLYRLVSPHAMEPTASKRPVLALRPVSSAMHPGVVTCHPGATLRDVARMMANLGIHAVVVWGDEEDDSEGFWGVVSDLDLVIAAARGEVLARPAVGAARTEVVTVPSNETLLHAAHLMEQHRVTHLVVVDGERGRPIGVLSTLDVARALAGATT